MPAAAAAGGGPGVRAAADGRQPRGGRADGRGGLRLRAGRPRALSHRHAVGAADAAGRHKDTAFIVRKLVSPKMFQI